MFSISFSKLNSGLLACNSLVHLLFHTSIWQLQAVHFLPPSLHFDAYMDLLSSTIPYMGVWGRGDKNVLRLLWVLMECTQNVPITFFSSVLLMVTSYWLVPLLSLPSKITLNRQRYKLATFFTLFTHHFLFFSTLFKRPRSLLCVQLNVLNSLAYGRIVMFVCAEYLCSSCHLHRHSSFALKSSHIYRALCRCARHCAKC